MPNRQLRQPDRVIQLARNRRVVLPDAFYDVIPENLRSAAFTISKIDQITEIRTVFASLNRAIEEGTSFTEWKDTVDVNSFGALSNARKQLVYRMHTQVAYNQGRISFAEENKDLLPYFRYQAVLDERTRESHQILHGLTRPQDDPIWDDRIPPLGFNCRCQINGISRAVAQRGGTKRDTSAGPGTGRGLTPPSQVEQLSRIAGPDTGFRGIQREPAGTLRKLTNFMRRRTRTLPDVIRTVLTSELLLRTARSQTWFQRNAELFRRPDEI